MKNLMLQPLAARAAADHKMGERRVDRSQRHGHPLGIRPQSLDQNEPVSRVPPADPGTENIRLLTKSRSAALPALHRHGRNRNLDRQ